MGCGEGELAIRLASAGLAVRGTDASAEVVAEARRRARAAGRRDRLPRGPGPEPRSALRRRRADRLLRGARAPRRSRSRRSTALATLARPWLLVSVPREPLWRGAQPRPAQVRRRARQHARPPRPLVEAPVPRLPRAAGRGGRGAQPAAVDDGALQGGPAMNAARAARRLGPRAAGDAGDRLPRDRLGRGHAHDGLGAARPLRRGPGARQRARRRSTAGTGRPATSPGSTATTTRSSRPGWRRSRPRSTCSSTPPAAARLPPTPRREAAKADQPRWAPNDGAPWSSFGYDPARAERVQERVEDATPVVWVLTLFAAVIPAIAAAPDGPPDRRPARARLRHRGRDHARASARS